MDLLWVEIFLVSPQIVTFWFLISYCVNNLYENHSILWTRLISPWHYHLHDSFWLVGGTMKGRVSHPTVIFMLFPTTSCIAVHQKSFIRTSRWYIVSNSIVGIVSRRWRFVEEKSRLRELGLTIQAVQLLPSSIWVCMRGSLSALQVETRTWALALLSCLFAVATLFESQCSIQVIIYVLIHIFLPSVTIGRY